MSEQEDDLPEHVIDEAIAWMVRAQSGEMTDEERQSLKAWRLADVQHETAWQRFVAIGDDFSSISLDQRETARKTLDLTWSRRNRRDTLKCLAWIGASGTLFWGGAKLPAVRRLAADHATPIGVQEVVHVNGTEIRLNTDTILDIGHDNRSFQLRRGEINVAMSTGDPLAFNTQHGRFSAKDARFVLRDLGAATRIAAIEGTVVLSPQYEPTNETQVAAGSSFTVSRDKIANARLFERMDPAAWTQGLLVVRGMHLEEVAAELSRYNAGLIRVASSVAALEVSGVYRIASVTQTFGALEAQLPVRVERYAGMLTIIRSA
ncbi:MAG: DUF4880 domain-containing protein [Pseudomonadota bacterium]